MSIKLKIGELSSKFSNYVLYFLLYLSILSNRMNITNEHLESQVASNGKTILKMSQESPVLLVFLRHFGCIFCKESLFDISKQKQQIQDAGINIIFVHMSDRVEAESFFKNYDLGNVVHIADPLCKLYSLFGLVKGSFNQLFGLKTWIRGAEIIAVKQQMPGLLRIGDGFQMPGIFLLRDGAVVSSFIHNSVADKPNYESFVNICKVG
jgi:peroxiredoxin